MAAVRAARGGLTMAQAGAARLKAWGVPLCAAMLPVVLLAPFANKAYHLDDPLSLWTAQHILEDPLRFFDYPVNWTGVEGPAYLVIKNPPFSMYYMAAVGAFFGWGETPMHLAFLLPAALASLGTYLVARRLCREPMLACAAATLTPAVMVSSSTVMTTVTMLAFYVWAIETWLRGLDTNRNRWFFVSAALMSASALSQYFGASTVPLLFAYTLLKRPKPGTWVIALTLPVVVLLGYEWLTRQLFGVGLFFEAGNYASLYRASERTSFGLRLLSGLAYTGGCIWIAFWFAPLYGRRATIALAALVALGATAGWFLHDALIEAAARQGSELPRGTLAAHFGVFVAAGALVLAIALYDLWRERSPESVFLLLWVFGAFAFAAIFNWTINARSLLGMAAPAAILAVRQLERARPLGSPRPWLRWLPVAPMAVVALALVYADFTIANGARNAARHFNRELPIGAGQKIFFGHWGFQYYMQQGNAKPFDLSGTRVGPGDVIILPDNNMQSLAVPEIYSHRYPLAFKVFPWASTWNYHIGAAYYSGTWGPLPYVFGPAPTEKYVALLIDREQVLKDPKIETLNADDLLKRH